MPLQEYMVKVSKALEPEVTQLLGLGAPPQYVRISTIGPLSNWGYPAGAEGSILRIDDRGILMGVEGRDDVPRDFVPWQNIAYLSDGTQLFRTQQQQQQQQQQMQQQLQQQMMQPPPPPISKR